MNRKPPKLAVWLLECFNLPRRKPDLMGDLAEEYNSGRSVAWFWWQTAVAIGIALTRGIGFYPKLFVLRGLATGWLVGYVLGILWPMIRPFLEQHENLLGLALLSIPWCTGWVVGRTHRHYPGVAALACFGWACILQAWFFYRNYDHIRNSPVRNNFANEVVINLVALLLLLVAGVLASAPKKKRSPVR
jgi:hypothetical protein